MQRPSLLQVSLLGLLAASLLAVSPYALAGKQKKAPASAVHTDDAPDMVTYGQREDVMRFGAELADRQGLDAAWVQAALQRARFVPTVTKYIMPPAAGHCEKRGPLSRPLHRAEARRRGRCVLAGEREVAEARRGHLRRAARDH